MSATSAWVDSFGNTLEERQNRQKMIDEVNEEARNTGTTPSGALNSRPNSPRAFFSGSSTSRSSTA